MAEYGDYKKEIKTLGDLRTFVNETLKSIDDDYTFDIDDDFMGIDIILTANCDVSYSEKSFYWTANVNYVTDVKKVVEDRIKVRHKIKALEILKRFIWVEDDKLMCGRYGDVEIELDESDFEDDEEFDLLKGILNDEQ